MLFQAVGLGYGEPGAGLMERRPRDPEEPILPRPTMLWLVAIGLVMGVATLGTITWAEGGVQPPVALTMGVVTFSLASLSSRSPRRDESRTVFSLDTVSDKTLVRSTAASVVTLILTTVFGPLQAFLQTVSLDLGQWLIWRGGRPTGAACLEIRVIVLRRRTAHPAA